MANYQKVTTNGADACELSCERKICKAFMGPGSLRRHLVLQRGDRLDAEDGSCRKIWIILNGMTAVSIGLADGRRQFLALETPGNIVCGMSTGPHSGAWIEALCETELCELNLDMLGSSFGDAAIGQEIVAELFVITHQRLENCSAHLVTLGRLDSTERVTLFLLDMAYRIGRQCDAALFVELPMTREDIADYLGLNTETISRIFSRLKKSRLVQFPSRSAFSIPDPKALERRLPLSVPTPATARHLHAFLTATDGRLEQDGAL